MPADEAELDALSQASLAAADRAELRKVEFIQELARRQPSGKSKRLTLRFLVSPVELIGDETGHVKQMRLVRNVLSVSYTHLDVYKRQAHGRAAHWPHSGREKKLGITN